MLFCDILYTYHTCISKRITNKINDLIHFMPLLISPDIPFVRCHGVILGKKNVA